VPTNVLTDKACRALVCPANQQTLKAFDGHGLHLLVKPSKAKAWHMAYRLAGKPQTASFGPYPEVSLAEARFKRDALRKLLREGINPKAKSAPPEPEKPKMTLREGMQAYWDGRASVSAGYKQNAIRAFEMHLTGILDVGMAEIDRAALMGELRKMDAAKRFVYVRRVRMWASLVFDWALEHPEQTGVTANPAAAINPEKAFGKAPVKSHPALGLAELPDFMRRLAAEDQAMQSVLACRLMALTWVRTQELRFMEWGELEQGGKLWRIPEGKMKRRFEHLVPLSRQAQAIIQTMRARSRGSSYVFPCDAGRRKDRPMSENAVLYLIGRMGYEGRMTGHGWRSIASTWANESGRYGGDAIERQLAHTPDNKVRAAYNRAAYLGERTRMMQDWGDWLDQVGGISATRNDAETKSRSAT
jgi:integrase